MYTNQKLRLGFLAHPRTGSRAIARHLCDLKQKFGFLLDGKHHTGPAEPLDPNWTYFTVVRNHFDAITSWYFTFQGQSLVEGEGRRKPSITKKWLTNFIAKHPNYLRKPKLWWFTDLPRIVIVRYEDLPDSLAEVLKKFDLTLDEIPTFGYADHRQGTTYQDAFTPAARDVVESTWGKEMKKLGYAWED